MPVTPVLDEVAQRYSPKGFIADIVFPPLNKLGAETGQFAVWDSNNMKIPDDAVRAVNGEAKSIVSPEPSYVSYTTITEALKDVVGQREMSMADAGGLGGDKLRFAKTKKLVDQLMLIKELKLATKLTTSGNYETNYSTSLSTPWDNADADVFSNILTAVNKVEDGNVFPNALVTDLKVWRALQKHTQLLELMKYTQAGRLSEEDFYSIFELKIIIAKARYLSGSTWTPVWGDNAIVCYIPELGSGEQPADQDVSFGRTIYSENYSVKEFEAPEKDHKSAQWIEVEHAYTQEFTGIDNTTDKDSIAGYLIANCLT